MADLGAVGLTLRSTQQANLPLDVYQAKDATLYPVGGRHRVDTFYRDPQTSKTVRGTVLDDAGNPIARTVLCVSQTTLEVLSSTTSSATTGAFDLRAPDTRAVTIVALPNPGDNRNAVVLHNLTPVNPTVSAVGSLAGLATSNILPGNDPYFSFVGLLVHGNGTNGQTTFTDNSVSAKTLTTLGDAQVTTTGSKWGNGCMLFDGTGDAVTAADSNDFRFGTGDFTMEAWVYLAAVGAFREIFRFEASGISYHLRVTTAGALSFGTSGDTVIQNGLSASTWYHVAVTRQSSLCRTFIDGVMGASPVTVANDFNGTAGTFYIGGNTFKWSGRIEDARITKGVARYTSSFTPPTAPFTNT